jgi:hypothetical protein
MGDGMRTRATFVSAPNEVFDNARRVWPAVFGAGGDSAKYAFSIRLAVCAKPYSGRPELEVRAGPLVRAAFVSCPTRTMAISSLLNGRVFTGNGHAHMWRRF